MDDYIIYINWLIETKKKYFHENKLMAMFDNSKYVYIYEDGKKYYYCVSDCIIDNVPMKNLNDRKKYVIKNNFGTNLELLNNKFNLKYGFPTSLIKYGYLNLSSNYNYHFKIIQWFIELFNNNNFIKIKYKNFKFNYIRNEYIINYNFWWTENKIYMNAFSIDNKKYNFMNYLCCIFDDYLTELPPNILDLQQIYGSKYLLKNQFIFNNIINNYFIKIPVGHNIPEDIIYKINDDKMNIKKRMKINDVNYDLLKIGRTILLVPYPLFN